MTGAVVAASAVGVDAGATLTKLAFRDPAGELHFELMPGRSGQTVAERIEELAPSTVGLTGGGGTEIADRVSRPSQTVDEFKAWTAGASGLLARAEITSDDRYLLVSLGTGTTALLVDGAASDRVGGTALGGGTVLGLGSALCGCSDFERLCELADKGSRRNVDLLVSDIYRTGESPIWGDVTASSFAKLSRLDPSTTASPEDLASAIMGLIGENVTLICSGLARSNQVKQVVFGGATLRGNAPLRAILETLSSALGLQAILLPDGEFAGAMGALELARQAPLPESDPVLAGR
jgi:type II pantothenate kinase